MAIPRWDCDQSVEVIAGFAAEVNDTTPLLSSAIDLTLNDRARGKLLVVFRAAASPSGAFAHGVTFTVTESASAAGVYTACTTSGSLAIVSAAGRRTASINFNNAKPFIKLVATGDDADTLAFVTGLLIAIKPTI